MSDFNILIGVDMTNAENEIKQSINNIGKNYKLKLDMIIDNKDTIIKEIKTIQSLFNRLGSLDVDFGLKDNFNDAEYIKNKLTSLSNIDLSDVGEGLAKSMDGALKKLEDVKREYKGLMSIIDRTDNTGNKTQTIKTGDRFANRTKTNVYQADGSIIDKSPIDTRNFDALDSYVSKAMNKIDSMKNVSKLYIDDVAKLTERLVALHTKLANGDDDFNKEITSINNLIERYNKLEVEMLEVNATREAQAKEAIKWSNKLAEVEQKNFANPASKKKLGRLVGELDKDEFKALDQLQNKLKEIQNQYAKIQGQEKKIAFSRKVQSEYEKIDKMVNRGKLDSRYVSDKDAKQLKGSVDSVKESDNLLQLENSLKKVNKVYDEMLKKQSQAIENEIRQAKQAKISASSIEWNKQIDKIKSDGFINEREFEGLRKTMKLLSADTETFEKDLQRVETQLKRLGTLSIKRAEKQESIDISKGRNNGKIEAMKGVVPDGILNDVKALNNLLDFSSSKKDIAFIEDEMKKLTSLNNEILKAGKDEEKIRKAIANHQKTIIKATDKYSDTISDILHNSNRLIVDADRKNIVEQESLSIYREINHLRERGTEISDEEHRSIQQRITALRQLSQHQRDVESDDKKRNTLEQQINDKFASVSYRATRGFGENSKEAVELRKFIRQIEQEVNGLSSKVGTEFYEATNAIQSRMKELNSLSRRLRDDDQQRRSSMSGQLVNALKKAPIWASAMSVFYGAVQQVRQGIQSILDIDAAMIDLAKVSEASQDQLNTFKETASELGRDLGVVAKDVIEATTAFQKLGYTLQESTALGKNSILYANVGDMSVNSASDNIISTVKGFGVEVDAQGYNVRSIVDMFNEVSNNYAISAEGIGESLKRSSSVMNEAGNTIQETIGLATAANAVIQDPKKVGNALKTVAMRLRGVSEEGEEVQELAPQLQTTFDRINKEFGLMGNEALNVMEKDKVTFKSTYEIFEEVVRIWDKLSDMEQANLVETMGGKHQGVVVSAIIQNWKDADEASKTAMNSAGSASQEFGAYMDGFEYKIGQLKNAVERFWSHLIDSDAVKAMIDALTEIVDAITWLTDTFGATNLTVMLTGLLLVLGSKELRDSVTKVGGLGRAFEGLTGFVKKFVGIIPRMMPYIAILMAISTVAGLVIDSIYAESKARKERLKVLDTEISKYKQFKKSYEDTFETKDFNLDDFSKLQSKGENRTTEEEQKYLEVVSKIKDTMPELISYYNEKNEAVIKSATEIKNLVEQNERLMLQSEKQQLKVKIDDTSFKDARKKIEQIKDAENRLASTDSIDKMQSVAKSYLQSEVKEINSSNYIEVLRGFNDKVTAVYSELPENIRRFSFAQTQALNSIIPQSEDKNAALKSLEEMISINKTMRIQYENEVEALKSSLINGSENIVEIINSSFDIARREKGINVNTNKFLFIEELKRNMIENMDLFGEDLGKTIENISDYMEQAITDVESRGISIDDIIKPNFETFEKTKREIQEIRDALAEQNPENPIIKMYDELILTHHKAYNAVKNKPIQPFEFTKDVMGSVQSLISDISDLDSAYRTLNDGEELSLSTTMDLITKHPKLIKHMKMEGGVLKLTSQSLKDLAKVREDTFKADLRQKREQRQAALKTAETQIKANKVEMESLKAKMKVLNIANNVAPTKAPFANDPSEEYNPFGVSFDPLNGVKDKLTENYNKELQEYNDAIKAGEKNIQDIQNEIMGIDKILSQDWTSQLGNINSPSKKDDKTKDLQDAIYVVDQYAKKIAWLNRLIEKQQKLQSENSVWTNAYKKSLNEEIYLTNEKRKAIDAEIASLNEQIRKKSILQTGLISIDDKANENKTQRAIAAELAQEIDKAQDRLRELGSESDAVATRINELRMMQVSAMTETYNIQREMLSDDIAYQEYAMSLYGETTQAYRDHATEKLKLIKEQQTYNKQELEYLLKQRDANKNLTNAQINELNELIRAKKQAVWEMAGTITEIETLIANSELEKYLYQMASESKKYADMISEIEDKIKYDLDEDKDMGKHIDYLKQILALRKGEKADIEKNINYLEKQLEKNKYNKEMVEKISSELESWKDSLRDADNAIKDTSLSIQDVYKKLSDQYVDMYKEQLELMKQADEKYYDEKLKAEQKAHDKRMKQIDKEMNALQEAYDKQMKLIDRAENQRTHENDVIKLQKEADELKKQIDLLSMDDSYEAKAKKAELIKQLTEKEMELAELEHKREVELRKENLEDDLEAEKEKLNNKKDKYQEDYENLVDSLEEEAKKKQEYWEEELINEKKFAEMRKEVLAGNFEEMLKTVELWSDNVSNRMGDLGKQVTENFTYKVQDAIEALNQLNDTKIGSYNNTTSNSGSTNIDGDSKLTAEVPKNNELEDFDIIAEMKRNSKRWKEAKTDEERDIYFQANQKLGKGIGAVYKNGSWYKNGKKLYELRSGGFTGDWSGDEGRLAVLHKKELVLNDKQTKHILDTVKIMNKVKSFMPSNMLNGISINQSDNASRPVEHNEFNIEVKVNGSADRKVAETVSDQIVQKIKRTKGGRF